MTLFAVADSLAALIPRASEEQVKKTLRWTESYVQDTALATTTALSERVAARVKQKSRLIGALFCPDTAVTGAATNFFTLLIDKRTAAAPGTPVNLITYAADTATTDDAAAFGSKDLYTLTYLAGGVAAGADFNFEEGDVATVEVTKAASGMTFPSGKIYFVFEGRD